MTCPANDTCGEKNAFTCLNEGLLLGCYFHRCAGTTAGIASPTTERRLAWPLAKRKAGREALVLVLTQPAWKAGHFLVAEGSMSTLTVEVVVSQRLAGAFPSTSARLRLMGTAELTA